MMAINNRERVDRALNILGQALYPYVEREMQAVHKERWLTTAQSCLPDHQTSKDNPENILRRDVAALLIVMSKQWDKVFKKNQKNKGLSQSERALVSELIEIRNNWAHGSTFSLDNSYRALDSIIRLLKAIEASESEINNIEKQKQEVIRILADPTRYENRPPSAEDERIREQLAELLKRLPFQDASILNLALTHRSYLYENPKEVNEDNECLECLGDALIGFLSSEFLYRSGSVKNEAQLTNLRSKLVDEKQLAKFAVDLDIGKWIRLGKGEVASGGRTKPSLLSNTFEAIVGAYFLDSGIEAVRDFVEPLFTSATKEIVPSDPDVNTKGLVDSKNRFQEWVQANVSQTPPKYVTVHAGGEPHAPEFLAKVLVGEKEYGEGKGRSKKDAEKRAAENALANLKRRGLI
jgi:ribonuclease III